MPWMPLEGDEFPTLGYLVADWLEEFCCHGPGDVQGDRLVLDREWLTFLEAAYRLDPTTGKRVVDRAVLSRPKGRAKSELAGLVAVAEALAPVRFDGWDAAGQPVGRPVRSPLIKCLATEESQAGNTFGVAAFILGDWGKDHHPDVFGGVSGARQYQSATALYLPDGGELRASTAGSASKDGGKETFVVPDEALAVSTVLPTPTGWTTMAEVRPGDKLVGSDGLPTTVVKITNVTDDRTCWRVRFSDGTWLVASDGHLWQTRRCASAAKPRVRTTGEMVTDGGRFRVPRASPLKTPDRDLPIDPYVLGLWLGDGDARNATISVGRDDCAAVTAEVEKRGHTVRPCVTRHDGPDLLYVSLPGSHRNRYSPVKGLKVRLREHNLLANKHVPPDYLRASFDQRAELFRGLMDADGHISGRGQCVFVQTSQVIVDDFVELARSLGQVVAVTWRADNRSRSGGCYKVSFTPYRLVPFSLPRKAHKVRDARHGPDWVTVTAIEPVPSEPVRCVAVDAPDRLFLAGDGWRTTHNTHLYVLPELRSMYATVARNTGKRAIAEPWMLATTTAYRPGQQSVAEAVLTAWRKGELPNPDRWLIDHREAKGRIDLDDEPHTKAQLRQVYGDAAGWMDLDRVYRTMRDPTECEDDATAARYFLNRAVSTKDAWIALDVVERQARAEAVEPGTPVALGFDGSLRDDATVLIGSRMSDGFLFPVGIWAKPSGPEGNWWEVPRSDVLASVREAFARYDVTRLYADPHEWRSDIDALAELLGEERVIPWETRRDVAMAAALDRLRTDLMNGVRWHSGDPVFVEHFGSAYVRRKGGHRLVRKEHDQSNRKIDCVVGAALADEARVDAIEAGWGRPKSALTRVRGRASAY